MSLLGIKGWGFAIDWSSFLFGLKLSEADEFLTIFEEEDDDDYFNDSTALVFFVGPFSVLLIF